MQYAHVVEILLSLVILLSRQFKYTSAMGSVTHTTTNGFPSTFLSDIVKSDVVKRKVLSRWKWQVWDVMPGTHVNKFYIFNITNPDEVEKGEKPILQELGPYYYSENRQKYDVSVNLDLSVNYGRNVSYTFNESASHGTESDLVTTINIPLMVFSTLAAKHSPSLSEANEAITELTSSGESLLKKLVKVEDLLFHGMNVTKYQKYLNLMGPETPLKQEFRNGLLTVLKLKNGTYQDMLTVDSGLKIESQVGNILQYNGKPNLTYWQGDNCNKIEGSDGSVFAPRPKSKDSLHILEMDLCRSISFNFTKEVHYDNVVGHLYSISKDVLEDPSTSKSEECFCRKENKDEHGKCLKKGVLDVSSCQFDAPYVMSYAHFLDASTEYPKAVAGLHPDSERHQTQVIIEPVTGAVIAFRKRYQTNVWIKPLAGINYFQKFPTMIFPILWNDYNYNLKQDMEELLVQELARQAGGGGVLG